MTGRTQRGFSLLEIVLLVLIVGIVLASVLKGQEMITSARVKRLAGQLDEIRAAYLGFEDRYRALPGDYAEAHLTLKCGAAPCPHGNGDNRIRDNESVVDGNEPHEDILVWTHLVSAGLLKGNYQMAPGASNASDSNTPKNPYMAYMQIVFDDSYGTAAGFPHHNLKTGAQVPVEVLAELDLKTDDGKPYGGTLQFSPYAANGAPAPGSACVTGAGEQGRWNIASRSTNCGAALLL